MKTKRDAQTKSGALKPQKGAKRPKSNALKPQKGAKRHSRRKHSPPLIPVPEKLNGLLNLVNLCPPHFERLYRFENILGAAALPMDKLPLLLDRLPLKLQAFVVRDRQGEIDEF